MRPSRAAFLDAAAVHKYAACVLYWHLRRITIEKTVLKNSPQQCCVDANGAVRGKDVYFMPLVARRRVLAPTSERSTNRGFALRGIKHTSFPVESCL